MHKYQSGSGVGSYFATTVSILYYKQKEVFEMNIYQNCMDLIQTYIYGGAEFTANTELVAVLLSTTATVFLFSLPFLVVWKVLKLI